MAPSFLNLPARVVYRKPIIFLVDEFSTSAGDIFPSMMQDNGRGPLVGTRTSGAGGGQRFVEDFTRIMAGEIRKARQ